MGVAGGNVLCRRSAITDNLLLAAFQVESLDATEDALSKLGVEYHK